MRRLAFCFTILLAVLSISAFADFEESLVRERATVQRRAGRRQSWPQSKSSVTAASAVPSAASSAVPLRI